MSSDDDRARPPAAKRRRMDESIFIHVSGGNSVINNYFVAGLDGLPLAMVPAVPAGPQPAVPAVPAVPAAVPAAVPVAVPVVPAAGCCKGMTRDQDLGHDPVVHQAEAYAQAMMRAQAVQSINDILWGIAIPFTVFDREALFEYMQVMGKKLAMAAKMNVAIKAFLMRALFSEEIVDATKATGAIDRKLVTDDIKDHFRTACLNVFVMLRTEEDSIFDNIDDFRFVTHQKLVEVDISKANGKTIVPVIHKHIKKKVIEVKDILARYDMNVLNGLDGTGMTGVGVCMIEQLPDTKPFIIQRNAKMVDTGIWEVIARQDVHFASPMVSHFDVRDYVLLDKDCDHKLDINVRDFGDDDPHSWIFYDNNKNVDQVVTYMQAHPHLRT
eukprot:m51a1_g4172 hypothetical protein (383) ;mRNA; r:332616-340488